MNRSFQAFAVLLVSLAGGMLAATWTSAYSLRPPAAVAISKGASAEPGLHCSCNPESLARYEEGCARDKTTGELYGCGLGLGKNGAGGKSVISGAVDTAIATPARVIVGLKRLLDGQEWQGFATGMNELASHHAAARNQASDINPPQDPSYQEDYAAAELAAAGFQPERTGERLHLQGTLKTVASAFTPRSVDNYSRLTWTQLQRIEQYFRRQTRLWLVESGFHRQWDDAVDLFAEQDRVAGLWLQFPHEDLDRWFESFPPSITDPDILLNPSQPEHEPSNQSRRIILATANLLESLSALLHQTAENLARHADQDVAKLHTLKSDIEGRR